MNRWADWETERTVAHIWWCGDDECDCIQPVIERITPNREAGYPWIRRETIWAGTFVSRGSYWTDGPDDDALEKELQAACQERGIIYNRGNPT